MDKPSQDVIDLGRAGRDIRHSLSRRSGVASWRQSRCRLASQDMLVTRRGRCKKKSRVKPGSDSCISRPLLQALVDDVPHVVIVAATYIVQLFASFTAIRIDRVNRFGPRREH